VKNGTNYDVGPIGFTLDDLKRLKVKVTNGPVMAIGMWGYMPVQTTGILVIIIIIIINIIIIPICTLTHK